MRAIPSSGTVTARMWLASVRERHESDPAILEVAERLAERARMLRLARTGRSVPISYVSLTQILPAEVSMADGRVLLRALVDGGYLRVVREDQRAPVLQLTEASTA